MRELDPKYRDTDRSAQEILNGMRGGDYWTPSDYDTEPDYDNLEVIQYLLDEEVEIEDL